MDRFVLIPFGAISVDLVAVRQALEAEFPVAASVGLTEAVPEDAYDPRRGQYLTRPFLKALRRRRAADGRALGLTDVDLCVPELNFVFGEADHASGCAVVSVARPAAGLPDGPADPRWRRRVATEAVHEVGHLYGLGHCRDPRCAPRLPPAARPGR